MIRHLQVFVEVAKCGKMSLAASKLFISQPTVSQIIADLEKTYQVRLFERLPKQLYLTAAGKTLYDCSCEVLACYNHLNEVMMSDNPSCPLRLGATVTVGASVMPEIVSVFLEKYPKADARLYVNNTQMIEERLLENELDIAVVEGNIQNENLVTIPVIEDSLIVVCGPEHPLANHDDVDLNILCQNPFILREAGSGTRRLFEEYVQHRGLTLDVKWECTNTDTIKEAVKRNRGITVISQRLVKKELADGSLCAINRASMRWERAFSLVYHKKKYIAGNLKSFIEIVEGYGG